MIKNGMCGIYFLNNPQDIVNIENSIAKNDKNNIKAMLNDYVDCTAFMQYNYLILDNYVLDFNCKNNIIFNINYKNKELYNSAYFIEEYPLIIINVDENDIYYKDFELYMQKQMYDLKTIEYKTLCLKRGLGNAQAGFDTLLNKFNLYNRIHDKVAEYDYLDYYYIVLNDKYSIIYKQCDIVENGEKSKSAILQHFADRRQSQCYKKLKIA